MLDQAAAQGCCPVRPPLPCSSTLSQPCRPRPFQRPCARSQGYPLVVRPPQRHASSLAASAAAAAEGPSASELAVVKERRAALREAVLLEMEAQEQQQRAAYRRSSLRRLQADGLVLLGLVARAEDRLYSDFVWRLCLPDGGRLPYHRFRQGDSVVLAGGGPRAGGHHSSPGSGGEDSGSEDGGSGKGSARRGGGAGLEGTVLGVEREGLLVAVSKEASEELGALPADTRWRVDQGFSSVTAERQLAAIARLGRRHDPACRGEAAVQAVLLGGAQARLERIAAQPTAWAQDAAWRADARQHLAAATARLNPSQAAAVTKAMTRTFTLWQGPPGTGKTRTLLAYVEAMVRTAAADPLRRHAQGPLLAAADTNAAADNLLEGLLERGIAAVRVGQPAKVRPELRRACLEAQVEGTAAGQRAARLRDNAAALLQQAREARQRQQALVAAHQAATGRGAGFSKAGGADARAQAVLRAAVELEDAARDLQRRADDAWRRAEALVADEAASLLRGAQVVVSTCAGAGEARLEALPFRAVVLDEASQATEPSSLVPLVRGAQSVVMAGDQRQLPPTVLSRQAARQGLDVPLFSRLLDDGMPCLLLEVQYRMHPAIAAFPSQRFYAGRLRSGVGPRERPLIQGVPWPNPDCPVLFCNVDGSEERTDGGGGGGKAGSGGGGEESGGQSYRNPAEAEAAVKALRRLLQDTSLGSVALLSPYSGQVRLLTSLLARALPEGEAAARRVTVSTVDGYQGREADAVIFSTVRCNPAGRLGFLQDERRLNVAVTRARRGLLVLGHRATLRNDANWAAWLDWVAAQHQAGREAAAAAAQVATRRPAAEAAAASP